ncbi:protein phosphatase 2C domain-containing protein [Candidatus Falkowbacteria bacterium]|nr:protein phosphatase 2C domain-containing protein [Candidatus Falkowbacteria bacterium]
MKNRFIVSFGSVPGSYHRQLFKNNQDAVHVDKSERLLVGVVCDGCGSGAHSEVGAELAARFIVQWLMSKSEPLSAPDVDFEKILEEMREEILEFFRQCAAPLGENLTQIVLEYFLFTVVGFVATEKQTVLFTKGDGVFALNGELAAIDENNEPSYLSFGLLSQEKARQKFVIRKILDTAGLENLIIATDGLSELENRKNETIAICGDNQLVGGIGQFVAEDKYGRNASALQKRLNVLGLNHKLLTDDTTVALLRKRREA